MNTSSTESLVTYFIIALYLGNTNIFGFPYCENDRLWRKMLAITPDRYNKAVEQQFDECHNAFIKPKPPVNITEMLTLGLHKRSDFEQQ